MGRHTHEHGNQFWAVAEKCGKALGTDLSDVEMNRRKQYYIQAYESLIYTVLLHHLRMPMFSLLLAQLGVKSVPENVLILESADGASLQYDEEHMERAAACDHKGNVRFAFAPALRNDGIFLQKCMVRWD
ncbi:hypothetical protein HK097_006139 [Rhizophlyctis rosea]|uniref:Uncharacterized protein n=1 Tax=Rhizophlyctis rosea TaxID=64517 RepID=A0AAD5SEJ0_9FUNG|nr:hypothetical protein HK097_006139 [Rhizophlyctis rosea]